MKDKGVIGACIMSAVALLLSLVQMGDSTLSSKGNIVAQTIDSTTFLTVPTYDTYIVDSNSVTTDATENTVSNPEDTTQQTLTTVLPEQTIIVPEKRCPFISGTKNTVITFIDRLRQTVDIKPGVYAVELASFHIPVAPLTTTQNFQEAWHLELQDAEGINTFQSPEIRDLRDTESTAIELVEGNVTITSHSQEAYARLASGAQMEQGFVPLCASLRLLGEITTSPNTLTTPPLVVPTSTVQIITTPLQTEVPFTVNNLQTPEMVHQQLNARNGVMQTSMTVVPPAFQQGITPVFVSGGEMENPQPKPLSQEAISAVRQEILTKFDGKGMFETLLSASQHKRQELVRQLYENEAVRNAKIVFTQESFTRTAFDEQSEKMEESLSKTETALQTFRFNNRTELATYVDTDGDGVTDYDEIYLYETDPNNSYSAGGVLTDGERLLLGLDPRSDSMIVEPVESPKVSGEVNEKVFSIELISLRGPEDASVVIAGHAAPFSFVTLFVYSTPVLVTVRADGEGAFEYVLDETLEDGSHELYVASVNASGKILAKSNPIPFVKTAQAIEYTPTVIPSAGSPVDSAIQTLVAFSLLLILLVSISVTIVIGYVKTRQQNEVVDTEIAA